MKQNRTHKTFVKDIVPGDMGIADRRGLYMVISTCVAKDENWTVLTLLFCDGTIDNAMRYNSYWVLDIVSD